MEFKEVQKKSIPELEKLLSEERQRLQELKFKAANDQLKNVRQVREVRKTIAQLLTLIKQKIVPVAKSASQLSVKKGNS